MDIENSKQREIETIEEEWVVNSQNDRVVRKYFQVILKWHLLLHNYYIHVTPPRTTDTQWRHK